MKKIIILMIFSLLFSCSNDKTLVSENKELKKENTQLKTQLKNLTNTDIIIQKEKENCEINTDKIVVDAGITPELQEWTQVDLLNNYYKCWKNINRWDIAKRKRRYRDYCRSRICKGW